MSEDRSKGRTFARWIHFPRTIGLGFGFLCVASVFYQNETSAFVWLGLVANAFIWPHVAYFISKNSNNSYEAERRNLVIDSFLGGIWIPLMSFNILPCATIIFMLSMDNISVGGFRLFAKGALAMLMGGVLAIVLHGLQMRPESTLLNVLACIPMLGVFPLSTGFMSYRLAKKLSHSRKEIEKVNSEIREAHAKLRLLSDNATDVIWTVDMDMGLTYVSPSVTRLLGFTEEEAMARTMKQAYTNEAYEKALQIFAEEMAVEYSGQGDPARSRIMELELIRKDGNVVPVEGNFCFIRDPKGKAVGILSIMRDITERKRTELALKEAYKDLQSSKDQVIQSEKLAAIGLLASGVAHEILNPLNILSMKLQMLEMTPQSENDLKQSMEICRNQIDRIVGIVSGLRKFSRMPEKKLSLKKIEVLIDDVLSLIAPRIKVEGIHVEVQYAPPELPPVCMDEASMEQVLFNILSNAMDAMRDREEKKLRISAAGKNGDVLITISDTGHGIKNENLLRLFDPFFTTKDPDKGTGLGLSISYGIIKDHKGRIWAENNEWGGATFFIQIPFGEVPSPDGTLKGKPSTRS